MSRAHADEDRWHAGRADDDEAQAIAAWVKRNTAPRPVARGSRDLVKQFVLDTTREIYPVRSMHWSARALRAIVGAL